MTDRTKNETETEAEAGLRRRLIDAGVELVHAEGAQALSLREIARRAGVSHGAPRRYFPTHLDLLSAIAREGFAELRDRVTAALAAGSDDPRAELDALARVYLDFALTRRGMYELMFRHDLLDSGRLGLRETSLPLFDLLARLVARARTEPGPDSSPELDPESGPEPAAVAAALWANLHGIAQLWGWGSLQLAARTDDVEPLLRTALDAHVGPAGRAR
ncbi:TetR/AcrR family transcriptional regulator [Streptomyces sp. NPDC003035]|uniref:TetR/AcrR family transcriptional regulator n=1 Tax=Streptomyces sp. NPDC003035 TaxID=3364676 RepID=UPI0036C884EB